MTRSVQHRKLHGPWMVNFIAGRGCNVQIDPRLGTSRFLIFLELYKYQSVFLPVERKIATSYALSHCLSVV